MKIGDRELSSKDLALLFILAVAAGVAIWALIGAKPKPIVLKPSPRGGAVLMEGGQPGGGYGQFSYPRGIAVDNDGDIFVADSRAHRIQKIDGKTGKFVDQFGGFVEAGKLSGGDL